MTTLWKNGFWRQPPPPPGSEDPAKACQSVGYNIDSTDYNRQVSINRGQGARYHICMESEIRGYGAKVGRQSAVA